MREVNRAFRLLVLATVLLFVVVAVLSVGGYLRLSDQVDKNTRATEALCFQREDIDQRIANTERILKLYPNAKLIFAIPRSVIINGLRRDMRTRENLNIIDCG